MKTFFLALLALVVAVTVGHFVADDPGFIVIGYGGKVLRTTFAFFLVVLVVAALALYFIVRLLANVLELRGRWSRWTGDYRRRRAHRSLADGLLALASGDFSRAERLFSRGADSDAQPEVHYLAAAQAAQAMNAAARRDNYLRLAHDVEPKICDALDTQRAEWLLDNGQSDAAANLLSNLTAKNPGNPQLLKLKKMLFERTQDAAALLALVPDLRRDRVVAHDEADRIERQAAFEILEQPQTSREALSSKWDALPRPLRAKPEVVAAYTRQLLAFGEHEPAERLVRKQLERRWDARLVALYGDIECSPPMMQLIKADGWAVTRADDPQLLLTRARLALRSELWGQAREHLQKLLDRNANSPLLSRLMAEVADGIDKPEEAAHWRKTGLELATDDDAHVAMETAA